MLKAILRYLAWLASDERRTWKRNQEQLTVHCSLDVGHILQEALENVSRKGVERKEGVRGKKGARCFSPPDQDWFLPLLP
jgi:hypothetical protein